MAITIKQLKEVLEGYITHYNEVKDGCQCAICIAQEYNTYIDGLSQVIKIIDNRK